MVLGLWMPILETKKLAKQDCPVECECEKSMIRNDTIIAVYCHKVRLDLLTSKANYFHQRFDLNTMLNYFQSLPFE